MVVFNALSGLGCFGFQFDLKLGRVSIGRSDFYGYRLDYERTFGVGIAKYSMFSSKELAGVLSHISSL